MPSLPRPIPAGRLVLPWKDATLRAMENNSVDGQLKTLVAGFLKLEAEQLEPDSAAGDFPQWDSFAHANLIMEIERHFRVTFDVEDVLEMVSLGDIAAVLRRVSATAAPAS